jgi:hypothetical protein
MQKFKTSEEIAKDFQKFLELGQEFGKLIRGTLSSSDFNSEDIKSVLENYLYFKSELKKVEDALEKVNPEYPVTVVDKFLLDNFVEYLVDNYDMKSCKVRWIIHGTQASHSFEHHETREVKLIQDIAADYAKEKGYELPDAFNSEYLKNL